MALFDPKLDCALRYWKKKSNLGSADPILMMLNGKLSNRLHDVHGHECQWQQSIFPAISNLDIRIKGEVSYILKVFVSQVLNPPFLLATCHKQMFAYCDKNFTLQVLQLDVKTSNGP